MESLSIAVIIILYNPSEEDIRYTRDMAKLWNGIIVDNSTIPFTVERNIGNMMYICNKSNLGIAEAQNIALRILLKEQDITHIVFFDQDSRVHPSYPDDIVTEFKSIKQQEPKLAVLGPTVINKSTGDEYHSTIHKYTTDSNGFSIRREIISSGCCIAVDALHETGLMDGRLFIDFVDYEWCWRAQSKGLTCGISASVSINHKVGKRELRIRNYIVIISAPFRYFYQYRNYLWLLQRNYVPLQWKLAIGVKYFMRLFYFPLFVKGGYERWKYMLRGIKDGLKR